MKFHPGRFAAILLQVFAFHGWAQVPSAEVLTKENIAERSAAQSAWVSAAVGDRLVVRDRLRTGALSRATMRLTNLSVLRINERTTVEVLPPEQLSEKPGIDLKEGAIYFFSREKPREMQIRTPTATGALRGTEFHVRVESDGTTRVAMFEGALELSNRLGRVLVESGEAAEVEPGKAPRKTAMIEAINIIQWCLYYPGVLDADALALSPDERARLGPSLAAYRAGDLLHALERFPKNYEPPSPAGKVYFASVVLAVGQVPRAEELLRRVPSGTPGREALVQLIAAVKFQEYRRSKPPATAADWIAQSYYDQSRSALENARTAARQATKASPQFGFGWARLAELEFSFGRTRPALAALEKGVALAPRNAEAVSLRGFLLSAQNRIGRARASFDQAIALDGALGNAWLGRGLTYLRQGHDEQGRLDLQTAAALEPNRSILRSYLAKPFFNSGAGDRGRRELTRAIELDPHDPTPWLYSAVQNKQDNQINRGVRDLEQSLALNENRRVYRSRFLLDQDRGIRSSNLAAIYQADGMEEVAVREATRAVNSDYASAPAHLFLANSYNALRDPRRILLRYETPWFNELLLSNLLSPVGGGPLSQYVSQQEYSKLFEANRLGLSTLSEYFSTGEFRETASQFGIFGNFSYAIDTEYLYDNGLRPNNDISRFETYATAKYQVGPQDTLFLQAKFQDLRTGDVFQYYDPHFADSSLRVDSPQRPGLALIGWHHEWDPGQHTIFLGGRLASDQIIDRSDISRRILQRDQTGDVNGLFSERLDQTFASSFEIFSGELSHIATLGDHTLVLGGRYQAGEFSTRAALFHPRPEVAPRFPQPPSDQDVERPFERISIYGYHYWQPWRQLTLTAGLTYDRIVYPENFRLPPVSLRDKDLDHYSPKLGLTLEPVRDLVLRAAYTEAISGVTFDETVRLEPVQVAGFIQGGRTFISESEIGSIAAGRFKIFNAAIEQKFHTGTYWGLEWTLLKTEVDRGVGVFDLLPRNGEVPDIFPSNITESVEYEERALTATVNQLIGERFSVGARYRAAWSELQRRLPQVPLAVSASGRTLQESILQQAQLFALYNHPSGFFFRAEALWTRQDNDGYGFLANGRTAVPGDEFWQFNAFAGYRFRRNYGEIAVGILNATGENYALEPLNYYLDLPRDRTMVARVRLSF